MHVIYYDPVLDQDVGCRELFNYIANFVATLVNISWLFTVLLALVLNGISGTKIIKSICGGWRRYIEKLAFLLLFTQA